MEDSKLPSHRRPWRSRTIRAQYSSIETEEVLQFSEEGIFEKGYRAEQPARNEGHGCNESGPSKRKLAGDNLGSNIGGSSRSTEPSLLESEESDDQNCVGRKFKRKGSPMHTVRNRNSSSLFLAVNFIMLALPSISAQFNPAFGWMANDVYECPDGYDTTSALPTTCKTPAALPYSRVPAGQFRACTNDPSSIAKPAKRYSCSVPTDPGCNCNNECPKEFKTDVATFLATCLPVVVSMEDTWTKLSTYIYHNTGQVPSDTGIEDTYTGSEYIKVEVTVSYGNLDVYGTEPKCLYSSTTDTQVCDVDVLSIKEGRDITISADRPTMVQYQFFIGQLIDKKLLTIVGTFRAVVLAMKNLKYK